MNQTVNIKELETALITRAKTLAEEYLAHATGNRDQIISDASKRRNLREEREILTAKAAAERRFRQRVQAAEIKQQEELDRLRWGLIQKVMQELSTRFTQVAADEKVYLPLLRRYLAPWPSTTTNLWRRSTHRITHAWQRSGMSSVVKRRCTSTLSFPPTRWCVSVVCVCATPAIRYVWTIPSRRAWSACRMNCFRP
jgi:hypothetical protein